MRGGGICSLDSGHRRTHATATFACDGCGKIRRGRPHRTAPDGEYPNGLAFCFICSDERVIGRDDSGYGGW